MTSFTVRDEEDKARKQSERLTETLHVITLLWRLARDVVDCRVAQVRQRGLLNGLEHLPPSVAPILLAGDAVHVKDRLDGLWTQDIGCAHHFGEAWREALAVDSGLNILFVR